MRLGGSNHGHRACVITDDDLAPGAYPRQQSGEVAGRFRFRDVDDVLRHRRHYIVFETCEAARLPTPAIGRQTSSQTSNPPRATMKTTPSPETVRALPKTISAFLENRDSTGKRGLDTIYPTT